MKTRDLVAEDLRPLLDKLSPDERMRLARMALAPAQERTAGERTYPLRGVPVEYLDPAEPVAESDWSALR